MDQRQGLAGRRETNLISNNGYTWTDKDETLDIHEQLVAAGWTGFEPSCQRLVRKAQGAKHEPCGKTTAFAVITRAELEAYNKKHQEKPNV